MVHKEDGRKEKKNCSKGKKASSLLRHCLSSKWSHPRKGSTVDNTGLDLIRGLLTRSSTLPPHAALFQTSVSHQLLSFLYFFFLFSACVVYLLTYSKIGQRIWLKAVWTYTWSMFLSEQPWRLCISLILQVFQWRQLENLYFREKKFSVEVHDPRR